MNSQEVIKKRNRIFFWFIVNIVVFITAMILVAVFVDDYNDMTLINIILVVILMVISVSFRNVLFGYNTMARIAKVVLNQQGPIAYHSDIINQPELFLNKGFAVHANNNAYAIYYKVDEDRTLKVKNIKLLYLVLILKHPHMDFYDKNMHDDIAKLEETFTRKTYPSKYIITAFKEVHDMNEKTIKEIGEVVSYNQKRRSFNQINVGLYKEEKKAYFLYSNQYHPSNYYKLGVEFIKDIVTK
jgi:hypothetical protein